MEYKRIKLTDLVLNEGQVEGLPTNPRQWKRSELDKLKKSLEETPELLEARGILVYPHEDKYLVLGGNMRLSALKELKATDAPCIVFPEDTPVDKLKEIVIKDNGDFGDWDIDLLANEWDDLPLKEWGVDGLPDMENIKSQDDFKERFDKINNDNCLYPIVPEYDEDAEVFIILSRTKTDSNWLRERLGMQKMKSYKSDDVAKSNIISIEDLKDVLV